MTEFVEACRQEWKRLGVPDAVANEMAADLDADLAEARADGVSAEEVLGSGAFDPRSFAAEWATERGVIQAPTLVEVDDSPAVPEHKARNRTLTVIAIAAASIVALIGLGLTIHRSESVAVAKPFGPDARRFFPPAIGKFPIAVHSSSPVIHGLGVLLFLAGVVALVAAALYWSRRAHPSH